LVYRWYNAPQYKTIVVESQRIIGNNWLAIEPMINSPLRGAPDVVGKRKRWFCNKSGERNNQ